jgi:hypothetical protein
MSVKRDQPNPDKPEITNCKHQITIPKSQIRSKVEWLNPEFNPVNHVYPVKLKSLGNSFPIYHQFFMDVNRPASAGTLPPILNLSSILPLLLQDRQFFQL